MKVLNSYTTIGMKRRLWGVQEKECIDGEGEEEALLVEEKDANGAHLALVM